MALEVGDFAPWLKAWRLAPDGAPFVTSDVGSKLLPVRIGARDQGMLKLGHSVDERRGSKVLDWWDGHGAAPVLAYDDDAILMIRAAETWSLADIAREDDERALGILCACVERLHKGPLRRKPLDLPPLEKLFRGLEATAGQDGRLAKAWPVAKELIANQIDQVVLHGDVHHGNVLDFGPRGWLAIDPWGYFGERTYDYANIFKNPDVSFVTPAHLQRRLSSVAAKARLDRDRLLRWVYAHAGLSAAWSIEDGQDPATAFALMEIAGAELGV